MEPKHLEFGTCNDDFIGSNFDEPTVRISRQILGMFAVQSIPQMSRPYKGVVPVTQFFRKGHEATDFGMRNNTDLYAAHEGDVVVARADSTGYGYVICIKNVTYGIYTVYGHLNGMQGILVRVGDHVKERQLIGRSDNTGNSTGPHLHLELRVYPYNYPGNCVDPLRYMQVWNTSTPPPTPPPKPPPVPNPPPGPGPIPGRFRARALSELQVYSRQKRNSPIPGRKIPANSIQYIRARKFANEIQWVVLDDGTFVMAYDNGRELMRAL